MKLLYERKLKKKYFTVSSLGTSKCGTSSRSQTKSKYDGLITNKVISLCYLGNTSALCQYINVAFITYSIVVA